MSDTSIAPFGTVSSGMAPSGMTPSGTVMAADAPGSIDGGQAGGEGSVGGAAQAARPLPVPPLVLSSQYVREMSFRVPGAPGIYAVQQIRPHVMMHLDVQARQAQQDHPVYEVALLIQCTATTQPPVQGEAPPPTAFMVEFAYCGIFTLQNVAADAVEPVLLAECPRLLFPFARNVLADIVREGGFPPVMLQPIDFVAMWQERRAQAQAQIQLAAQASSGGEPDAGAAAG